MTRGRTAGGLVWWLVDGLSRLLRADERDAVLGDIAESGAGAAHSLREVLGLVIRRKAASWRTVFSRRARSDVHEEYSNMTEKTERGRFLTGVWCRKWLIIVPAVVSTAATLTITTLLPTRYQSSATILILEI